LVISGYIPVACWLYLWCMLGYAQEWLLRQCWQCFPAYAVLSLSIGQCTVPATHNSMHRTGHPLLHKLLSCGTHPLLHKLLSCGTHPRLHKLLSALTHKCGCLSATTACIFHTSYITSRHIIHSLVPPIETAHVPSRRVTCAKQDNSNACSQPPVTPASMPP
jgi:hypothetical protein